MTKRGKKSHKLFCFATIKQFAARNTKIIFDLAREQKSLATPDLV